MFSALGLLWPTVRALPSFWLACAFSRGQRLAPPSSLGGLHALVLRPKSVGISFPSSNVKRTQISDISEFKSNTVTPVPTEPLDQTRDEHRTSEPWMKFERVHEGKFITTIFIGA